MLSPSPPSSHDALSMRWPGTAAASSAPAPAKRRAIPSLANTGTASTLVVRTPATGSGTPLQSSYRQPNTSSTLHTTA
eukprot:504386-Prorocentrum_minimum.AAC.3